ncbi:MAG: YcxB family protein [Ruminococcus sp.]|nr:YcxB family protein [Ruminococcus sp.]MDE6784233.1 YcxB family protein [Ruminococcus sp.]
MENIKLKKSYRIPAEIYRESYREYQKKYVYPKKWAFFAVFLILAANFIYGAAKAPDNLLAYLLTVVCLALAAAQIYNPVQVRRRILETIAGMGETVYSITIADEYVEIATESFAENSEDDELPEPARLHRDGSLNVLEYDSFFILMYGKEIFYSIPKADFTEDEIETIRSCMN